MKKRIILLQTVIILITYSGFGQNSVDLKSIVEQKQLTAKKAANQEINFKSLVTDLIGGRYYQALIKNGILKQSDGEIQIKSTLYGIIRIFDTTRREKNYFEKLRWARNIQIGVGSSFTEENQINSINSSLTIALINKREYQGSVNFFDKNNISADDISSASALLDKAIVNIESQVNDNSLSTTAKDKLKKKYEKLFNEFNASTDFNKFNELLTNEEIKELERLWSSLTKKYDDIQKSLSGAPLLTYTYDGNYNGKKWEKLNNRLEFIVGFGNKKDSVRKYDLYAGAFYDMTQDTLNKLTVLNRKIFNLKFGVNKVLWKDKSDGSSLMEAFGGAEFQNINGGLYNNEKPNALKFDISLSFRLAKNLYLPLQVKYNQTYGRFEGYLDLKFDIVNIFK
jgi:hypothetical protein